MMQAPANMRALLATAAPTAYRGVARALEDAAFEVESATSPDAVRRLAIAIDPTVILVDGDAPSLGGTEAIERLRQVTEAPLLLLLREATPEARTVWLDAGADDCLSSPISATLLLARIRAVLRRTAPRASGGVTLRVGPLELDHLRHAAWLNGERLQLTPREWDILMVLMRRPGRLVTRQEILLAVWGRQHERDWHYLRVHIAHIRRKLGAAAGLLQTERGTGFRLEAST